MESVIAVDWSGVFSDGCDDGSSGACGGGDGGCCDDDERHQTYAWHQGQEQKRWPFYYG